MKVVLFDFETNGRDSSCSVLEAMLIKVEYDKNHNIINKEKLRRFYFPIEEFDFSAFMVHNISIERIKEERAKAKDQYPEHFKDDRYVLDWLKDVDILAAHNIAFDSQFLPEMLDKVYFCTMKGSKDIVNARNVNGNLKNPTLQESCLFFNVDFDSSSAHGAEYDTEKLLEMFSAMKEQKLLPFFHHPEKKKTKNSVEIRTKQGDIVKQITGHKLLPLEGLSFIITNSNLFGDTDGVNIYEYNSGNFFMTIDSKHLSTVKIKELTQDDFQIIEKEIKKTISVIGLENIKKISENFTKENGIIKQQSLFDF